MFTVTLTHTIDNNGSFCGDCDHCISEDDSDSYPWYWCKLFEETLSRTGNKWVLGDAIRVQACKDAEFEATLETKLENVHGEDYDRS